MVCPKDWRIVYFTIGIIYLNSFKWLIRPETILFSTLNALAAQSTTRGTPRSVWKKHIIQVAPHSPPRFVEFVCTKVVFQRIGFALKCMQKTFFVFSLWVQLNVYFSLTTKQTNTTRTEVCFPLECWSCQVVLGNCGLPSTQEEGIQYFETYHHLGYINIYWRSCKDERIALIFKITLRWIWCPLSHVLHIQMLALSF